MAVRLSQLVTPIAVAALWLVAQSMRGLSAHAALATIYIAALTWHLVALFRSLELAEPKAAEQRLWRREVDEPVVLACVTAVTLLLAPSLRVAGTPNPHVLLATTLLIWSCTEQTKLLLAPPPVIGVGGIIASLAAVALLPTFALALASHLGLLAWRMWRNRLALDWQRDVGVAAVLVVGVEILCRSLAIASPWQMVVAAWQSLHFVSSPGAVAAKWLATTSAAMIAAAVFLLATSGHRKSTIALTPCLLAVAPTFAIAANASSLPLLVVTTVFAVRGLVTIFAAVPFREVRACCVVVAASLLVLPNIWL